LATPGGDHSRMTTPLFCSCSLVGAPVFCPCSSIDHVLTLFLISCLSETNCPPRLRPSARPPVLCSPRQQSWPLPPPPPPPPQIKVREPRELIYLRLLQRSLSLWRCTHPPLPLQRTRWLSPRSPLHPAKTGASSRKAL